MTTSNAPNETSYFDLHINGLGYLNRIREVKPRNGSSFLACDIAALSGNSASPSYVRFDARVSGAEAKHLVRRCEEALKAEKKVLIGFRLGDLWSEVFTYAKGKHAGEQGVSLKARLLYIGWIKINGEIVYKAEKKADADEEQPTNDPSSTDQPAPRQAQAPAPRQEDFTQADAPALETVESF